MYSDSDLESAIAAGVLSADAATALRNHVAAHRHSPAVDEENFRLLTGFNDIFVAIAGVLLLVGAGWIGGEVHPAVGGAFVATAAWGLSEYFTRVRRMALPSIIFLLAFVGGVFATLATTLIQDGNVSQGDQPGAVLMAVSAAGAGVAAWFHWRRFQVPITIAAGAAAAVGVVALLIVAAVPGIESAIYPALLALGLGVFALAMRWDMSDTDRTTRRSDVAFWLHLLAAPLIVHPVFHMLGLMDGDPTIAEAFVVVALYVAMGLVALAIDRRALLVSALGYVIYAIIALFNRFDAISLNVALAAFVIGSALLMLSAFWHNARAMVVDILPGSLGGKLPLAHAA
jgi:MFS family permease